MVEKNKEENKNVYKRLFFWMIGVFLVIILSMSILIQERESSLKNYEENYIHNPCTDNQGFICLDKGEDYITYNPDVEYPVLIKDDENYVICDATRKEWGMCVGKDIPYTICESNEYATCFPKGYDYTNCGVGEDAVCVKEGIYSVYNGNYLNKCNIGQRAFCEA